MSQTDKDKLTATLNELLTREVHDMPIWMRDLFQHLISRDILPYFVGGFRLRLVLDTNVLFDTVWRLVVSRKAVILDKLANNPLLSICAPRVIEEEIMAKIEQKFPKEKRDEARHVAKKILDMIEIVDSESAENLQMAKEQIADRDPKDVHFLSLALEMKATGILTGDKDFQEGSVRTWSISEVGDTVTITGKGTLSFVILGGSLKLLSATAAFLVFMVWKALLYMVNFVLATAKTCVDFASVHPFISALIVLGLIVLEVKAGIIKNAGSKLAVLFKDAGEAFRDFLPTLRAIAGDGWVIATVLLEQHMEALRAIQKLQTVTNND